jgi:hypothetical protein
VNRGGMFRLGLLLVLIPFGQASAQIPPIAGGPDDISPAPVSAGRTSVALRAGQGERPLRPGDWVPADADLRVAVEPAPGSRVRAYRLEVFVIQKGERVPVEVPGLQELEKSTKKWVHTTMSAEDAEAGRWIWAGAFRPGDVVVVQWRDPDRDAVIPHPVTLRIVEAFGARLAFATPVAVIYPVSGEATVAASAGFSFRYYRISNAPFWRSMDRIGFPAAGFAYATLGGQKSILYSLGFSMLDDQLHLYYGGFRNSQTANNFWMVGLSLKTKDLMTAAGRVFK